MGVAAAAARRVEYRLTASDGVRLLRSERGRRRQKQHHQHRPCYILRLYDSSLGLRNSSWQCWQAFPTSFTCAMIALLSPPSATLASLSLAEANFAASFLKSSHSFQISGLASRS